MNVDLTNYVDNGEWELIDVRTVRRIITYACCPEPFPDVTFYLHMRRRTTYYTFNIIIPCTILSMLTIAGFFLPAESGEKVAHRLCNFSHSYQLVFSVADPGRIHGIPLPLTGPNSFVFVYIFTEKRPHRTSVPALWGWCPPSGNPGSATGFCQD